MGWLSTPKYEDGALNNTRNKSRNEGHFCSSFFTDLRANRSERVLRVLVDSFSPGFFVVLLDTTIPDSNGEQIVQAQLS